MDIAKILDLSPNRRQQDSSSDIEDINDMSADLTQIKNDMDLAVKNCDDQTRKIDCLSKELETLQHERLTQFEKLRNLHSDITSVESSIKRSEEEQTREAGKARMLMERYGSHLHQVNKIRIKNNMDPIQDYRCNGGFLNSDILNKSFPSISLDYLPRHLFPGLGMPPPPLFHPFPQSLLNPYASLQRHIMTPTSLSGPPPHQQQSPVSSAAPPPNFRQQPPPMKACLSCHQQIHRNAPICPLCKAKSRSKNPKKQKRKADEMSE